MNNHAHSSQIWVSLAVVIGLSLLAGCEGFWVNPALTAITVTPIAPSITMGSAIQLAATGTYSDGTTSAIAASWSSSDATIVMVVNDSTGMVKGIGLGTATITAANGAISGSTSIKVVCTGLQPNLQITPTNSSLSLTTGSVQFTATGTCSSGSEDLTSSASWASSNPAVAAFATGTNGKAALLSAGGPITITATVTGTTGMASGTTQLTITP